MNYLMDAGYDRFYMFLSLFCMLCSASSYTMDRQERWCSWRNLYIVRTQSLTLMPSHILKLTDFITSDQITYYCPILFVQLIMVVICMRIWACGFRAS